MADPWQELFGAMKDVYEELHGDESSDDIPQFSPTDGPGLTEEKRAKLIAETEVAKAVAAERRAKAVVESLKAQREQEKRASELAANVRHKVYVFNTEVSASSVKSCINALTEWSRQDPGCAITMHINSPGGTINDGFELIDFIRILRKEGHHITMIGFGWVASMAGVIMQAADHRVMGENSIMLIHEGSMGAIGDFGKVEDRVKLMNMYHARILDLFEERAKPINPKSTKKFIERRWHRTDWWVSAQDAAKYGFIDEVR